MGYAGGEGVMCVLCANINNSGQALGVCRNSQGEGEEEFNDWFLLSRPAWISKHIA